MCQNRSSSSVFAHSLDFHWLLVLTVNSMRSRLWAFEACLEGVILVAQLEWADPATVGGVIPWLGFWTVLLETRVMQFMCIHPFLLAHGSTMCPAPLSSHRPYFSIMIYFILDLGAKLSPFSFKLLIRTFGLFNHINIKTTKVSILASWIWFHWLCSSDGSSV